LTAVSFYCPEPSPTTTAHLGTVKGNPHPNASKPFVSWLPSKEGQLAMHDADNQVSVHKEPLAERTRRPYRFVKQHGREAWTISGGSHGPS